MGDGFICDVVLIDGIHECHSSYGEFLCLAEGVVLIKFSKIYPFVHDGFVLEQGCHVGEEVREFDGFIFVVDKFFMARDKVPHGVGDFA